jgi:hypothetical protein
MDEKDNTSLERGADNDIVRLRWRLKIRENVVARLLAENERLRNGAAPAGETVTLDDEERTLQTHTTQSVCSVQSECTLTKRERKAVEFAAGHFGAFKNQAATLRNLLARLS